MNLDEIFTGIRFLMNDSEAKPFFQPTELLFAANNAAMKVARDTKCLATHADINVLAYDDVLLDPLDTRREGRYPCPLNFLALDEMELVDGENRHPLYPKTRSQFLPYMVTDTPSRPSVYKFEYGATGTNVPPPGDIWFRPLPDRAYIARMVYFRFTSKLTTLQLDKSYELPEPMHMSVVYYACAILTMKDSDKTRYNGFLALYADSIQGDKELTNTVDQTAPKHIKSVY